MGKTAIAAVMADYEKILHAAQEYRMKAAKEHNLSSYSVWDAECKAYGKVIDLLTPVLAKEREQIEAAYKAGTDLNDPEFDNRAHMTASDYFTATYTTP